MFKFRSMYKDAEQQREALLHLNEVDGPLFKMRDDPRVTKVGKFMRRWSLDELPNLINVLRGEMSIVGPRPEVPELVDQYLPDYRRRHNVRPGITGLAQVSGRGSLTYEQTMLYDLQYVDEHSPFRDLIILAKTVPAVLSRKGVQ